MADPSAGMRGAYYPVFLDLRGRRALVVGGGEVAARKAAGLLEAGAQVRVVAVEPGERLASWAEAGLVELEARAYREGDVRGAFVVFCATNDTQVNEAVFAEAEAAGVLVNVVDDPARCRFIVPSVVRRGALQMAVSTGGAAPAYAKRLRRELEKRYPEDLADFVELLAATRALVRKRVAGGEAERAPLLEAACAPEMLERFRAGGLRDAEDLYALAAAAVRGEGGEAL